MFRWNVESLYLLAHQTDEDDCKCQFASMATAPLLPVVQLLRELEMETQHVIVGYSVLIDGVLSRVIMVGDGVQLIPHGGPQVDDVQHGTKHPGTVAHQNIFQSAAAEYFLTYASG